MRHKGETIAKAQAAMARIAYQRQHRVASDEPIPLEYQFDIGTFRTRGEMSYGRELASLDVTPWHGQMRPYDTALCWTRPILRAEFRYLRKSSRYQFFQAIRFERRCRSRYGYLVPYQNVEIERIHPRSLRGRYLALPGMWSNLEVPRGCYVELPPCVSYVGSHLINDPNSGYWNVFCAEWCARVAAYILWEVYDTGRLWHIPSLLVQSILAMDLSLPLGSYANLEELHRLVRVIRDHPWDTVPVSHSRRGNQQTLDRSPGRRTPSSGDFILYDPFEEKVMTPGEYEAYQAVPRIIPDGHPMGFVFSDDYEAPLEEDDPMVDNEPQYEEYPASGGDDQQIANASAIPPSVPGPVNVPPRGEISVQTGEYRALTNFLRGLGVIVPNGSTIEALRAMANSHYEESPAPADGSVGYNGGAAAGGSAHGGTH